MCVRARVCIHMCEVCMYNGNALGQMHLPLHKHACRRPSPSYTAVVRPAEEKWPELQQKHFVFKPLSWDHINAIQKYMQKVSMPKLEELLDDVEV